MKNESGPSRTSVFHSHFSGTSEDMIAHTGPHGSEQVRPQGLHRVRDVLLQSADHISLELSAKDEVVPVRTSSVSKKNCAGVLERVRVRRMMLRGLQLVDVEQGSAASSQGFIPSTTTPSKSMDTLYLLVYTYVSGDPEQVQPDQGGQRDPVVLFEGRDFRVGVRGGGNKPSPCAGTMVRSSSICCSMLYFFRDRTSPDQVRSFSTKSKHDGSRSFSLMYIHRPSFTSHAFDFFVIFNCYRGKEQMSNLSNKEERDCDTRFQPEIFTIKCGW